MNQQPVAPSPAPWPDAALSWQRLPASGDDGFPQVFLFGLGGVVYRLGLSVYYSDPDYVLNPAYAGGFFNLPDPERGLYLNLRLEREDLPAASRLLGARRVVLDMPMAVGPLRFRFQRIKIAQANLQGPGQHGSELAAEVAAPDV